MTSLSSLPNIPRSATALAEWLACLILVLQVPRAQRKKHWPWILLAFGLGQFGLQELAGHMPLWFWILGMAINVAWMFLTIHLSEGTILRVQVYHTCKAFIYAEFVASLSWQLICYLGGYYKQTTNQLMNLWLILILLLLFYALLFYLLDKMQQNHRNQYALLNISPQSTWNSMIIMVMIFTISNTGFLLRSSNPLLDNASAIFMMRTFVDLCGILLFNLQENQRYEHYLHNDLVQMNSMFQSQYEQYQAYRESVQTVNRRFHDLKHQLDVIALESNSKKRLAYINSLRNDIKQFKADVKTGNPVADVVLTRKNAYCIQHDITFTCIADGKLLSGIDTMDLCSLLGNSLDNAIEAVEKIPDKEKRLIDLRISKKAGFVIYSLTNYNLNKTEFGQNGLPQTTKKDKSQPHGYGLKSLRLIAQKYNGTLSLSNEDHWFSLKMLLPLKEV